MKIKTEDLAYWFFRLNGFLSIVNFVVHKDTRNEPGGTDADILGVRFPHRAELFESPMPDFHEFTKITCPYIAIAEVKRGVCDLNGPWTSPEKRNIPRVLRAIGALPVEDVDVVAKKLYEQGCVEISNYYLSLICIGESPNSSVQKDYPLVPQILWSDIKTFIYNRFQKYGNVKTWHQPWDENGHNLWDLFDFYRDVDKFINNIELLL